jgi:PPM family protein phosphatase
VTWAHASRRNRWPVTDATNVATDRATGRWAWALAHGIGDRPEAATAADTAARVAAQTAARATPAAGIAAAGAALNATPAAGDGDAAITVATAHPSPDGTRVDLAWSGNVRAYTLVDGQVIQVTTDHTVARQRHDAGQPVTADSQLHHLLTSSARHGPVDRTSIVLPPGGRLLLCTATADLDPAGLRRALSRATDPQATVDQVLHRTGGANATVMLLHTPADSATAPNVQPARLARLASVAPSTGHTVNASPSAADTVQLIGHLRSLLAGEEQRRAHTGARR